MYIKLGPYSVNTLFINDVHTLPTFRDGAALELDMLEKVGSFHDQPASVFALRSFPGVTAHTAKFGHMELIGHQRTGSPSSALGVLICM
jgi:hypothetical protein